MGPFRRGDNVQDKLAAPEPAERSAAAASCEYRHFGNDSALLIVAVRTHPSAVPGKAHLRLPAGDQVPASAISFQPEAGLARIVFAVDRGVTLATGTVLELAIPPDLRVSVPEPVRRPAVGVPDGEREHAVAAAMAGAELAGLIDVLERRCAIAERVARDFQETRADATRLAQSYRETWEVRELLESREQAYLRSAGAVEAAEAVQRDLEKKLADAHAQGEAIVGLQAELAAARARSDEIETDRDAARETVMRIEADVEEALGVAEQAGTELVDARERASEAAARADRLQLERDRLQTERDQADRQRDEALAQVAAIKRDLAAASASIESWSAELAEARTRAADAESWLAAERTLHEARLVARAGPERQLSDLFAEAQRERLRKASIEEQRAQVAALEQQLERMKQRS